MTDEDEQAPEPERVRRPDWARAYVALLKSEVWVNATAAERAEMFEKRLSTGETEAA